jgi:type III restriction enzyme
MDSTVQIAQIIGRVLRQPGATHYQADRLNTAHFYVRVDRNDVFSQVVEDVRNGLGGNVPEVRILTSPPGTEEPKSLAPKKTCSVPRTASDNPAAAEPGETVLAKVHDYTRDTVNTRGEGRRRTVQQSIGSDETVDTDWVEFEQPNRVNARWVFRREVSRRYRPALTVIDTDGPKFDAKVGVGSSAYQSLSDNAAEAVDEYLRHAVIKQLKPKPYEIGSTLVRASSMETFTNSVHDGYDGLNELELKFARALDKTGLIWARNRSQTGYKIPLVTLGQTVWFFPDFIVWAGQEGSMCRHESHVHHRSRRPRRSCSPSSPTRTSPPPSRLSW